MLLTFSFQGINADNNVALMMVAVFGKSKLIKSSMKQLYFHYPSSGKKTLFAKSIKKNEI